MTNAEFDKEFDVIYENINKNGAPGLLPYEKSVILTQAAEMLVRKLAQSNLVLIPELITGYFDNAPGVGVIEKIDSRSVVFAMPPGYISILNETVKDAANEEYVVVPLTPTEYSILMAKPYKYPKRRTVWRLENSDTVDGYIEIIGRFGSTVNEYKARIVSLPEPIILEDISPDTIRGLSINASGTNLNPTLHPEILMFATGLAEKYYLDKYGSDGSGNN